MILYCFNVKANDGHKLFEVLSTHPRRSHLLTFQSLHADVCNVSSHRQQRCLRKNSQRIEFSQFIHASSSFHCDEVSFTQTLFGLTSNDLLKHRKMDYLDLIMSPLFIVIIIK